MSQFVQIGSTTPARATARNLTRIFWLQGITLAWMLLECGISLFAAASAHSPSMLAFGSDSLVELLSATVVLLQFAPRLSISERDAGKIAGALLYVLAAIVCGIAQASLVLRQHPKTTCIGIGITVAALFAMPLLAWLKRREARRINNAALAADAVQSATCAYLAAIALTGVAVNAIFHLAWFDSAAALVAVPLLVKEGRSAWKGKMCACCS
jgi:divalent metal cation (Fe/Co/Zn/Cd) transporter